MMQKKYISFDPTIVENFIKNYSGIDWDHKRDYNDKIYTKCYKCSGREFKQVINIGKYINVYCFRCGFKSSLFSYFKNLNILQKFLEFYSEYSHSSKYDIISSYNSLYMNNCQEEKEDILDGFSIFIKDYGLFPVNKITFAKEYIIRRTKNNINMINQCYADDKYIYIPIYNDFKICNYVSRRFVDLDNIPRYMTSSNNSKYGFKELNICFCFLDEYLSDMSNNTLYITEGLFDAFSINEVFKKYCSISLMGKTFTNKSISELSKYISRDTDIILCLDSPEKDKDIFYDIIKNGSKIIKTFPNLSIVVFEEGDPNDIFLKYPSKKLRNIVLNNRISFVNFYRKYYKYSKISKGIDNISDSDILDYIS